MKKIQKERANAVQRYLAGESPESICVSLGKTTRWLYKWVLRHTHDDPTWCEEYSRRPLHSPYRTPAETEDIGSVEPVQQGAFLRQSGHLMGDERHGGTTDSFTQHHWTYFAPS